MPGSGRNRGKQTGDDSIFNANWLPVFKEAIDDLCFLLSRNYGYRSSIELVGNRYRLSLRQRQAILRISASNQEIEHRTAKECNTNELPDNTIDIDGFNLLILIESALSGAYLFKCRDGTFRDISSIHGSYKRVAQTGDAIRITGERLKNLRLKQINWFLDAPVSNSGRLKTLMQSISDENGYNWHIELLNSPDHFLANSENIVVTSDGWILDKVKKWFNLSADLLSHSIKSANIIQV